MGADPGGRQIGRYSLHDVIATGGMATVHFGRLVDPLGFSRTVAIKRLHAHLVDNPNLVAMLRDEARIGARIRHPNVVPITDAMAADGEVFLVMDYVHGLSLSALLANVLDGAPAPALEVTLAIMANMLSGLHAAHEARGEDGRPLGIIHRDISPQNVLLGTDGIARIMDFGIAKAAGRSQHTEDGSLKGKLSYMAPEQLSAEGKRIDRRVDIYSASVVLWEMLTRRRLFKGEPGEVMAKIVKGDIQPPSACASDVPPELDAIVLRGLVRDRENRYGTAIEMADALARIHPGAPARFVGSWVEQAGGPALLKRGAVLASIERASSGYLPRRVVMAGQNAGLIADAETATVEPTEEFVSAEMSQDATSRDRDQGFGPGTASNDGAARLHIAEFTGTNTETGVTGRRDPTEPRRAYRDPAGATRRALVIGGGVAAVGLALGGVAVFSATHSERASAVDSAPPIQASSGSTVSSAKALAVPPPSPSDTPLPAPSATPSSVSSPSRAPSSVTSSVVPTPARAASTASARQEDSKPVQPPSDVPLPKNWSKKAEKAYGF